MEAFAVPELEEEFEEAAVEAAPLFKTEAVLRGSMEAVAARIVCVVPCTGEVANRDAEVLAAVVVVVDELRAGAVAARSFAGMVDSSVDELAVDVWVGSEALRAASAVAAAVDSEAMLAYIRTREADDRFCLYLCLCTRRLACELSASGEPCR